MPARTGSPRLNIWLRVLCPSLNSIRMFLPRFRRTVGLNRESTVRSLRRMKSSVRISLCPVSRSASRDNCEETSRSFGPLFLPSWVCEDCVWGYRRTAQLGRLTTEDTAVRCVRCRFLSRSAWLLQRLNEFLYETLAFWASCMWCRKCKKSWQLKKLIKSN